MYVMALEIAQLHFCKRLNEISATVRHVFNLRIVLDGIGKKLEGVRRF